MTRDVCGQRLCEQRLSQTLTLKNLESSYQNPNFQLRNPKGEPFGPNHRAAAPGGLPCCWVHNATRTSVSVQPRPSQITFGFGVGVGWWLARAAGATAGLHAGPPEPGPGFVLLDISAGQGTTRTWGRDTRRTPGLADLGTLLTASPMAARSPAAAPPTRPGVRKPPPAL